MRNNKFISLHKTATMNNSEKNNQEGRFEKECSLMEYLQARFPEKSRTAIKSLLTNKRVLVNGQPVSQYNFQLKPNYIVTLTNSKINETVSGTDFNILFEDEHIVVIDKRSGLLSIATDREKENTVYSMLSAYVKKFSRSNKIFIVHRLDRETSGLMVFAKSQASKESLQNNWDNNKIRRSYVALVEGSTRLDSDIIKSYLWEDKNYKMHSTYINTDGQEAITSYKVIKRNKGFSLLEVGLETGRKNQIRVHMQLIGHSIVGDKKYGASSNPVKRLGLHASKLSFIHPKTGNTLTFVSPTPKCFTRLISKE